MRLPSQYLKMMMLPFTSIFLNTHFAGIIAAMAGVQAVTGALSSRARRKGIQRGLAAQEEQFSQINELLAPYRDLGEQAIPQFKALLGIGEDGEYDAELAQKALTESPGFQFGLETGTKAIESGAAASGNLLSGKNLKDVIRFGTDYGTQFRNQRISELGGVIDLGRGAVSETNQYRSRLGDIQYQGQVGIGQEKGNTIASIGNAITSGFGNYMYQTNFNKYIGAMQSPVAATARQPIGTLPTGLQYTPPPSMSNAPPRTIGS